MQRRWNQDCRISLSSRYLTQPCGTSSPGPGVGSFYAAIAQQMAQGDPQRASMCHHIHRYKLIGPFLSRNSQLPFADSGWLQIHSATVVFGQALQPPPFLFPCISASWQLPPRRPLSKSGIVHPPKHPITDVAATRGSSPPPTPQTPAVVVATCWIWESPQRHGAVQRIPTLDNSHL